MKFTDYYFNLGYQSTLEKVAARKKKDEGMSLGAKLGLGAAGLGAAGLLGLYGGDALSSAGDWLQSVSPTQVPMDPSILSQIGQRASDLGQTWQDAVAPATGSISDAIAAIKSGGISNAAEHFKSNQYLRDILNPEALSKMNYGSGVLAP